MAKFYIRNIEDGPRDYPLNDGTSIYLPPKGKPVHWTEIEDKNFSPALERAEERGFISVKRTLDEPKAQTNKKTADKAVSTEVNA